MGGYLSTLQGYVSDFQSFFIFFSSLFSKIICNIWDVLIFVFFCFCLLLTNDFPHWDNKVVYNCAVLNNQEV